MSEPEIKSIGAFEIKDADKGEVTAIVNTLNIVDRDGDVVLPGAIANGAKVKISAYSHGVIKYGDAPVGKGVVTIEGDRAVFRGTYFLSTERGRDAFETVKALGADSEWSIGFRTLKSSAPTDEWKTKGARRMLTQLDVMEVSPVFLGANAQTATVAVKQADGDDGEVARITEIVTKTLEKERSDAIAAKAESDRIAAEQQAIEAKALADKQAAELKAANDAAAAEFERFQRTMKKLTA